MAQEPPNPTPIVAVHTSAESERTAPPWLAEAVLVLQVAREGGLLGALQQQVRLGRGRMGTFELCDFALVLLVYAVSGELTLLALYATMAPCAKLLFALWSRKHLPARSTLSRFLSAITVPTMEALREVVFCDLLAHGLAGPSVGGLLDRQGQRHVLFDADGTRQAARQRQVIQDPEHPPVHRRLSRLCAPGYRGRKRGEAVRTRTPVQQAHTREWLGTFGAAGNGDCYGDLERACQYVVRYLQARGFSPQQGVLRLDGQYGYARGALTMARHGLGYVMRAADYRLLQDPCVQAALSGPPAGSFVQPDTGTLREVFDIGLLPWTTGKAPHSSLYARVVVTRRPLHKEAEPAVGKRQGDFILELFVTDRAATGWSALDVLSLYFARGGFEQTLSEEDREQEPDRWCSAHPPGQEFWQLLCQWVWNLRLRLGAAAQAKPLRRTLWAEAETSPPAPPAASVASLSPSEPSAPPVPAHVPGQVALACGRGSGKFAGSDFTWTDDQRLCCPEGKPLRPQESRVLGPRRLIRYEARTADCASCPQAAACRGTHASTQRGRRVSVYFPLPPAPALPPDPLPRLLPEPTRPGPHPLWWEDVPATALRRLCRLHVYAQKVEVATPPPLISVPAFLTRAQRAHRRLSWELRLARNAHPPQTQPWQVKLYGVPPGISAYLAGLTRAAA